LKQNEQYNNLFVQIKISLPNYTTSLQAYDDNLIQITSCHL